MSDPETLSYDEVYIIECRGWREVAQKHEDGTWTTLGSDYPDINPWSGVQPEVKVLAKLDIKKLSLEKYP